MKDRPFKIGLHCPGNGTGGPWRYVHALLEAMDGAEFGVTLFCDLPADEAPRPGVSVRRLTSAPAFAGGAMRPAEARPRGGDRPRRRSNLLAAPKLWAGFGRDAWRLSRVFRDHRLDLLHTQNTGCEEAAVAARLAGVPHVLGTFHVDSTYDLHGQRDSLRYRVLEHVSNHCLHRAIAVSERTGRDWITRTHLPRRRVVTIRNGIDADHAGRRLPAEEARHLLGVAAPGPVVGGVGRLDEAKGFAHLIRAAARVIADCPTLTVLIAGDGPLRGELTALAERLGIGTHVHFMGFRPDVQTVLDAMDVFALPSLCEALPYALLEAMATALPVVACDVGGVGEVVDHGRTGLVVPSADPVALADALHALVRDHSLCRRMGADGRERVVRHFDQRVSVEQTLNEYRNLLAPRHPPAAARQSRKPFAPAYWAGSHRIW